MVIQENENPYQKVLNIRQYYLNNNANAFKGNSKSRTDYLNENDIRSDISKNYAIGDVSKPTAVQKVKGATRSAAYILKSLTGIKNKLKDVSTSKETQILLENWFSGLVINQEIPNQGTFIKNLVAILDKKKKTVNDKSSETVENLVPKLAG